jgi:class 3 adenylate cyclase
VRNALARFDQTSFESRAARESARERLLRAAKKHGIVPLGFFDGQLRKARRPAMGKLPRGTVTFLLTDIEDSTRLLHQLGREYTAVLRLVRRIIRSCVRRASGDEVDCRADEFFAVFRDAARAIDAAVDIQRCLREKDWPRGDTVRVRIGVHTGKANLTDDGYVGISVHTAARICEASRGGFILVSDSTRASLDGAAHAGVGFQSLGRHALAGLAADQPLFLVTGADLASDFRGVRTRG